MTLQVCRAHCERFDSGREAFAHEDTVGHVELRLRLGALRLDADVVTDVFDRDSRVHGL